MDRNPFSSFLCEGKLNVNNEYEDSYAFSSLTIQLGLGTSCSLPSTSDLDI